MAGLFQLQSPRDLLEKLQREFEALRASPTNQDVAFNFFVTAEHLLDWQYPGNVNKKRRTQERQSEILLQICSHIASGAKHFRVEGTHHASVKNYRVEGAFDPNAFQNDAFDVGRLVVELDGPAAAELGSSINVVVLAEKLLSFWTGKITS